MQEAQPSGTLQGAYLFSASQETQLAGTLLNTSTGVQSSGTFPCISQPGTHYSGALQGAHYAGAMSGQSLINSLNVNTAPPAGTRQDVQSFFRCTKFWCLSG